VKDLYTENYKTLIKEVKKYPKCKVLAIMAPIGFSSYCTLKLLSLSLSHFGAYISLPKEITYSWTERLDIVKISILLSVGYTPIIPGIERLR
jgi:hypothetical protein